MKRILIIMMTAVIIFSIMNISVFADEDISVYVNISRKTDIESGDIITVLKVYGSFPLSYSGKKIVLSVTKAGIDLSDNSIPDNEKYFGIRESYINEDGSFNFQKDFMQDAGDYIIHIIADTMTKAKTVDFYNPSPEAINELIDSIKDKTINLETLIYEFNNNSKELGINDTVFKVLNQTAKSKICEDIIGNLNDFSIDGFTDFLDRSIILNGVNYAKSSNEIKAVIDFYKDSYLNLSDNPLYQDYVDFDLKDEIYNIMINIVYESIDKINDGIFNSLIIAKVKNISNASQISGIITQYKDEIGLSEALAGSKDEIFAMEKYIFERVASIKSIRDLKDIIVYAKNNVSSLIKEPVKSPSPSGGKGTTVSVGSNIENTDVPDLLTETGFKDVSKDFWGYEAISYLNRLNVVSGREDNAFYPNQNVTRAEFIKMLVLAYSLTYENASSDFSDVSKDMWYYNYISVAYKNGIVLGNDYNQFGPDGLMSRQDAAVMIKRIIDFKDISLKKNKDVSFSDSDNIADYAKEAVKALSECGYIKGYEDNMFYPQNQITRAEAAQLIYNILKA